MARQRQGYRRLGVVLQIVPDMDTLDIALRLGAATVVGVLLGLNRDLHGKPTGVRTLGVLCLGSALAVLSIHAVNPHLLSLSRRGAGWPPVAPHHRRRGVALRRQFRVGGGGAVSAIHSRLEAAAGAHSGDLRNPPVPREERSND